MFLIITLEEAQKHNLTLLKMKQIICKMIIWCVFYIVIEFQQIISN